MPSLREVILTAEEAEVIARVIARLRPTGSRRSDWDTPGIRAAMQHVAHLDGANVLMAALRLSQDRSAITPANIGKTNTECWREKPGTYIPQSTRCREHGVQHTGVCPSCRAEQVGNDEPTPPRTNTYGLDKDDIAAITSELRDHLAKPKETR